MTDLKQIIDFLSLISGETALFASTIVALLYGLFVKKFPVTTKHVTLVGMAIGLACLIYVSPADTSQEFIAESGIAKLLRMIILASGFFCVLLMPKSKFEIPILVNIATLSLMLMSASHDLMTMYITMEISALTMYICVASGKQKHFAGEAALKYFILGSVTSCFFLLGVSTVSGFSGSFDFYEVGSFRGHDLLFSFSLLLISSIFLFKMGIAPFHTWISSVYVGAPWYISLFLGTASKIAISGLFIRIIFFFYKCGLDIKMLLTITASASMLIGSLCAMKQRDLKKIFAFSSISNMGFGLASISLITEQGVASGFVYILLYTLCMFLPAFAVISLYSDGKRVYLNDLNGFVSKRPCASLILTVSVLSTAGLPPFAGFFGKFYIISSIIEDMEPKYIHPLSYILLGSLILSAILTAVYCLRIIKNMYFVGSRGNRVFTVTSVNPISITLLTVFATINIIYCIYSTQTVNTFLNLLNLRCGN